jgi:hypothetical protein
MAASPPRLPEALRAWNTNGFAAALTRELAALGPAVLPLQQGLSASSYALDGPVTAMFLSATETPTHLLARLGIFYSGIIAGCNCADDPSPVEAQPEYCEISVCIDKADARAEISLADAG